MYQRLRRFVNLAMLLFLLPAMAQSQELTDDDRTAIQTITERQNEAFRSDDAAGAFAFASPMIREKFGTAENSLHMVQIGYQPVYRLQGRKWGYPLAGSLSRATYPYAPLFWTFFRLRGVVKAALETPRVTHAAPQCSCISVGSPAGTTPVTLQDQGEGRCSSQRRCPAPGSW